MAVRYHHPDRNHMSIDFVHPDRSSVEAKADELDESETDVLSYDLDERAYVLYAGSEAPKSAEEVEMDPQRLASEVEAPTRTILIRSLQAFQAVVEDKRMEEDERLRAYKQLELEGVVDALDRVDWDGTVTEIGGRLMSNLILRHPFPNANHRTSLTMLERYVAANEREFDLPRVHTSDYEWKEWADEYIRKSKRILTVRRNAPRFYHLDELGCETVVRKGGIEIDLEQWDLMRDLNRSHEKYAEDHEELCEELTEQILQRQQEVDPAQSGLGRAEFAGYLEQLS